MIFSPMQQEDPDGLVGIPLGHSAVIHLLPRGCSRATPTRPQTGRSRPSKPDLWAQIGHMGLIWTRGRRPIAMGRRLVISESREFELVDRMGFEPTTSALRTLTPRNANSLMSKAHFVARFMTGRSGVFLVIWLQIQTIISYI